MNKKHDFATKVQTNPLEAIRRVVYDARKLEATADVVGVSHEVLSKQLRDDGTHLPLLRAAAIESYHDTDALAECFAARRGGIFLKLPRLDVHGIEDLRAGFAEYVEDFSVTAKDFAEMVADNKIEPDEVDKFERHALDMWTELQRLVHLARQQQGRAG